MEVHKVDGNGERTKELKTKGFHDFLEQPLVRMALATIPAGDHQDNLRMLLEAAHSAGFGAGQVDVIRDLTSAALSHAKKNGGGVEVYAALRS